MPCIRPLGGTGMVSGHEFRHATQRQHRRVPIYAPDCRTTGVGSLVRGRVVSILRDFLQDFIEIGTHLF